MDLTKKITLLQQTAIKKLPKRLDNFKDCLVVIDQFVVCILCCQEMPLYTKDQEITYRFIFEHLNNDSHVKSDLQLMNVGVDKLFQYIKKEKFYNKELVSKNFDKIYCKLCEVVIDITQDELEQLESINLHLIGMHRDVFLNELIESLPDNEENALHVTLKSDQIICQLCSVNIKIAAKLEITVNNLKIHVLSSLHKKLLKQFKSSKSEVEGNLNEESIINEIFSDIPEINRKYMMMHNTGELFCQLCNCFIALDLISVLNHIECTDHSKLIATDTSGAINEDPNKIDDCLKLMEERQNRASKDHYVVENTFLNSQIEFRPLYIEGKNNVVYTELINNLQPDFRRILEQNRCYIYLKNCKYNCSLCFDQLDFKIFFEHLNTFEHLDRMQKDLELFPATEKNQNHVRLKLLFGQKKFDLVEKNLCYLQRIGNVYICTLCSVIFEVQPDLLQYSAENSHVRLSIVNNLTRHMTSFNHIIAKKVFTQNLMDTSALAGNNTANNVKSNSMSETVSCTKTDSVPKTETHDPVLNAYTVAAYDAYMKLSEVFNTEIPTIIEENVRFLISVKKKYLMCVLCNIEFKVPESFFTVKALFEHMKSEKHIESFKSLVESSTNAESLFTNSTVSYFDNIHLTEIFGATMPKIIENNKTILIMTDKKVFACKLCNCLLVSCKANEQPVLKFSFHLKSRKHKECRKEFMHNLLKFENFFLNTNLDRQYSLLVEKEKLLNASSSFTEIPNLKTSVDDKLVTSDMENSKTPASSEMQDKTMSAHVNCIRTSSVFDKPLISSSFGTATHHSFETRNTAAHHSIDTRNTAAPHSIDTNTTAHHFLETRNTAIHHSIETKNTEVKDIKNFASLVEIRSVPVSKFEHSAFSIKKEHPTPYKGSDFQSDETSKINMSVLETKEQLCTASSSDLKTKKSVPCLASKETVPTISLAKEHLPKSSYMYLKSIFGSVLPKIINDNKTFLSPYCNGCLCTLCDVFIKAPYRVDSALLNFTQHLESYKHREMVKSSKGVLPQPVTPRVNFFFYNKSFTNNQTSSSSVAGKKSEFSEDKNSIFGAKTSYFDDKAVKSNYSKTNSSPCNSNRNFTSNNDRETVTKNYLKLNSKTDSLQAKKSSIEEKDFTSKNYKKKSGKEDVGEARTRKPVNDNWFTKSKHN